MGRALSVIGVPAGAGPYTAALEGLTALDEYILKSNPQIPRLHDAGVVYTKIATDKWRDVNAVLATKTGDCEALSTWRAAELRVSGEDPNASVVVYKTGPSKYHAIVLRGDGSLEDPSVEMGMKPPTGLLTAYDNWNEAIAAAPKQEDQPMVMGGNEDVACAVIGANDDPSDVEIVFDVHATDDGYKGVLRIPFADGRAIFAQTSTSATTKEAANKAQRVLGVIGAFWDDLAALLPSEQAQAAIRIAKNQHVQNLATDAYHAGKRALGGGSSSSSGGRTRDPGLKRAIQRQRQTAATTAPDESGDSELAPGDELEAETANTFDDGQGLMYEGGFYDDNGAFVPSGGDVIGAIVAHELTCLGAVNDALARGSKPRTTVGAWFGGATGSKPSGGSTRAPAGGGAQRAGGGQQRGGAQTPPGMRAAPTPAQGLATYGPGGMTPQQLAQAAAGSPYNPAFNPYAQPAYGSPYGGPQAPMTPTARQAYQQQLQQIAMKDAMLAQSGGSGGGSGGGGGGGFDGSDYTAADAAASQQSDADLFNAYYGWEAMTDAQNAYADQAQEVSPETFYGTTDLYTAEAMLADDTIPAE